MSELPGLCITVLQRVQSQLVELEGLMENLLSAARISLSAVSKACVWKVEGQDSIASARNHPCGLCLLFNESYKQTLGWQLLPKGSGEVCVSQWRCVQEMYRKNGVCTLCPSVMLQKDISRSTEDLTSNSSLAKLNPCGESCSMCFRAVFHSGGQCAVSQGFRRHGPNTCQGTPCTSLKWW